MAKTHVSATGIYTSGDGFTKVAVVTGTRQSTGKALAKGTVNIAVFSPTGKRYDRENVPVTEVPTAHGFFPQPILGPVTLGIKG